jgi:hypothetical protein
LLGFLATDPDPTTLTVRLYCTGAIRVKLAVTLFGPPIVKEMGFVEPV